MSRPLIRRLLLALLVIALLVAGVMWMKRPKPVAVVLAEIDQGRVESSIANTRAGTGEACQRAARAKLVRWCRKRRAQA